MALKVRKLGSTNYPFLILMVDTTDHITGLTGAAVSVTLSKSGAAPAPAAGAITEVGSGWYALAGNATDRNALGELALHATAAGADPTDEKYTIVPYDPFLIFDSSNRVDLVDAPNATAVLAIQNGLASLAKLLSYVRSLARKDFAADADIGGSYDAASDSLEAIEEEMALLVPGTPIEQTIEITETHITSP